MLVLNQHDLDYVRDARERVAAYAAANGLPFFAISAATGEGVEALVKHLGAAVTQERITKGPITPATDLDEDGDGSDAGTNATSR